MERCQAVLTPDTGLMHLALALARPVLTFTHPRYDIRKLLPPRVNAPVRAVSLSPGEQFAPPRRGRWPEDGNGRCAATPRNTRLAKRAAVCYGCPRGSAMGTAGSVN
jgi:ADP-heptose:LPS heptosyltransferase